MKNPRLQLKNRLKEYRKARGMTQTELAKRVGASKNTISSIETGQFCPTAYLAALLCLALDCGFEDVFYLDLEEQESTCFALPKNEKLGEES